MEPFFFRRSGDRLPTLWRFAKRHSMWDAIPLGLTLERASILTRRFPESDMNASTATILVTAVTRNCRGDTYAIFFENRRLYLANGNFCSFTSKPVALAVRSSP
jgi:hypothetical protein